MDGADGADGTGDGGGGTPLVLTKEIVTRVTTEEAGGENFLFTNDNEFEAVDTGIGVPAGTKTILLNYGASNTNAQSGVDLPWWPVTIEEYNRLDPTTVGAGPTAATCRFTRTWRNDNISVNGATGARQIWFGKLANGNIVLWSDNDSWDIIPFRVRFEIHEDVEVVTDATGNVVGGDGTGGADGADGADGATGPAGPAGAAGAAGPKGDTGDTGDMGDPGAAGAAGSDGSDGAAGAAGTAGTDGDDGATGPAGAAGAAGAAGPKGDTGDMGDTGDAGAAGAAGTAGADGADGMDGATGPAGAAGATGATGPAGMDGADGADGSDGSGGSGSSQGTKTELGTLTVTTATNGAGNDVTLSGDPEAGTTCVLVLEETSRNFKRHYYFEADSYIEGDLIIGKDHRNGAVSAGNWSHGSYSIQRQNATSLRFIHSHLSTLDPLTLTVLEIPTGAKGDQGDDGADGAAGPAGRWRRRRSRGGWRSGGRWR